jgi:hypothetical protein
LTDSKKAGFILGNLDRKGRAPKVSKRLGSVITAAAKWVEKAIIKKGEKIGEGWVAEAVAAIKI